MFVKSHRTIKEELKMTLGGDFGWCMFDEKFRER
jgi:hypothetical protein